MKLRLRVLDMILGFVSAVVLSIRRVYALIIMMNVVFI